MAISAAESPLSARHVWARFERQVKEQGKNPLHNPLFHERQSCSCVIDVLRDGNRLHNVVLDTKSKLQHGEVEEAYLFLREIRGVGPKIASFFLRDVALRYGIEPPTQRGLLQPIDVWIRRFVRSLDQKVPLRDSAVQEWVVDHSEYPELANAGMWYFGARIAPQKLIYNRALSDPRYARTLAQRFAERMARAVAAWETA